MRNPILSYKLIAFVSFVLACSPSAVGSEPNADVQFNRDIRPILSDACFACHGPDKNARQAELRLDDREAAIGSGAIIEGDANASSIIARILSNDPDEVMPPPKTGKKLTDAQLAKLRSWIDTGAKYEPHWAFLPVPTNVIPPKSTSGSWQSWPRSEIDQFTLATMSEHGMQPAEEADRLRWLRRVRLDLTGLPPTLEEIRELQSDDSEITKARIVDRLLESEAFGERMANMWLDVARYADTFGYQFDVNMEVWPWRDWVIRAFSNNLPYDKFITWQIAGDLIPDANDDSRLATTFNRLHRQTNEGGSIEEEFRQVYVADRTVTAGTAFLGLTLECSRCHDHKYDPILQKDFYSLAAYFADIDEHGLYSHFTRGTPTPALSLYSEGQKQKHEELLQAIRNAESKLRECQEEGGKKWVAEGSGRVATTSELYVEPPASTWSNPLEGSEPGVFGTATKFNGDDAVSFPLTVTDNNAPDKPKQIQLGRSDPFSISLWVKPSHHADRVIIAHQCQAAEDSAFRGLQLVLQQGRPQFSLIHFWPGDALQVEADDAIPIDQWTHLGVTYDGSSRALGVHLFVNGERVHASVNRDQLTRDIRHRSEWGDASAGSIPFSLGARFRDIGFRDGCMDELHIFDRQLSLMEMARLYVHAPMVEERSEFLQNVLTFWDPCSLRGHADYDAIESELRSLRDQENEFVVQVRQIMTMKPATITRVTHVLERGAYDSPRDAVAPQVLQRLSSFERRETYPGENPDRLELARWLVDEKNPLASRVAVNRFWSIFFGRGIVASLEDFGSQGQVPTHPELLDWLARDFMNHGWNVKRLCKQIVLSSTYRQSSTPRQSEWEVSDPDNRWLARGPRHRLSAEQVRDATLFATGLLVPTVGGPSVMPYQPPGLWEESGTGKTYQQAKGDGLYRRSMYTFWRRTAPPPSMLAFDATSRETCTARRETTTTPLQALVLLNDPQYVEAARAVAETVIKQFPEDRSARWEDLGLRILSRPLTVKERDVIESAYMEQRRYFQSNAEGTQAFLTVGDRVADTNIDATDLAATTVVAETLLCFDEFVMKR